MRRTIVIALALLAVALPAAADEVYSWKDARGVTHYSQTPPPPGTRFEVRRVAGGPAAATTGTPAVPTNAPASASAGNAAAGDTTQCELARTNVAALKGDGAVQQVGADGKPRALGTNERADQLALSEAAVRAYCR